MKTKNLQIKQNAELVQTLINRAWKHAEFKEQLSNNPKVAIESVTGKKVAEDKRIVVEDQTDKSIVYLNIPSKPNLEELELTEGQLEKISGGFPILATLAVCGIVYAVGKGVYDASTNGE